MPTRPAVMGVTEVRRLTAKHAGILHKCGTMSQRRNWTTCMNVSSVLIINRPGL